MAQGPELSEMQQRVEAAGSRFREVAEDRRQRRERLAGLLDQMNSQAASASVWAHIPSSSTWPAAKG